MVFSDSTMNKLSLLNGLVSQIAMTFLSNALTSVISLLLAGLRGRGDQDITFNITFQEFTAMNFFSKKSFSSIANLYMPTSILGGLLIRYYGMKK